MARRDVNAWTRWLHIYFSMFSFAALLFFAVTGITLNHPAWIEGQQKVERFTGKVDPSWVTISDTAPVARLEIVEYLRNTYMIKARLTDFRTEDTECSVSFNGPGYGADAFIDRSTGSYELTTTYAGNIAILNDIHKGRDTGTAFAKVIDISAILMIVVSLTGFLMIFFLIKKKVNGLLIAFLGLVFFIVLCYMLI
jgi:hypothetical protein